MRVSGDAFGAARRSGAVEGREPTWFDRLVAAGSKCVTGSTGLALGLVGVAIVLCGSRTVARGVAPPGTVSGQVWYYSSGQGVPAVSVQMFGDAQLSAATDDSGQYTVPGVSQGDWRIEPSKVGQFSDGISSLDAAYILQSVGGLRRLDDLQRLACDVTGNGTVTSLDAARILQLRAGLIRRLPVAEACGSDWVFVPLATGEPYQRVIVPEMGSGCPRGQIALEPFELQAEAQNFVAVLFGDCTGNWRLNTPTGTASVAATSTPAPSETPTPSPTWTELPSETPTPTDTVTRTMTVTAIPTATAIPSRTATFTRPPPPTLTPTPSRTATRTVTSTYTATPTRTPSLTRTPTPTWSPTITQTPTRTQTPTLTLTPTPTPTATCPSGIRWAISEPRTLSVQNGGRIWLAKTVPTDVGWGIFWLWEDPELPTYARLFYAHVDFTGQLTDGPMHVLDVVRIPFRDHYYMAAWNQDHYGLLIADRQTLWYYGMGRDGVLSGRRSVGPPLYVSSVYDEEAAGDIDSFPDGFIGVVEGDCAGHSCSYAFKLDRDGVPTSLPINLVDYDYTHQFYPSVAFDGAGFAILSVKDIVISTGGVMTKYWPLTGSISSHVKVVPAKPYLWDEFPDIAWNGDHFAAIWTENSARSWDEPWQIHFATFRRTRTSGTPIADRVLDVHMPKTGHRWTTQVHAVGTEWVGQYTSRQTDGSLVAVYEWLDDAVQSKAVLTPFDMNADALGSSPHAAAPIPGTLGIARGYDNNGANTVTFYQLDPPACAQ